MFFFLFYSGLLYKSESFVKIPVAWLSVRVNTCPNSRMLQTFHHQREAWGTEKQWLIQSSKRDKQGHNYCGRFLRLLQPVLQGAVISGKIKWGRMTKEVLSGKDAQLFHTDSHQLLFSCGEGNEEWRAPTPLQACTTRGGLREGGWDEVTMRLLLYSLHTVRVLFTSELLRWGHVENVQSRRLLINAVSGF